MQDRDGTARHTPVFRRGRAGAASDEQHEIGGRQHFTSRAHTAIRSNHASVERVRVGKAALSAYRRTNGRVEPTGERRERRTRPRDDHAASTYNHWRLRGNKLLRCAIDVVGCGCRAHRRERIVAGLRPEFGGIDFMFLHVVRQTKMGGAWVAGCHRPEGRANGTRNLAGTIDHFVSGLYSASWSSSVSGYLPRESTDTSDVMPSTATDDSFASTNPGSR